MSQLGGWPVQHPYVVSLASLMHATCGSGSTAPLTDEGLAAVEHDHDAEQLLEGARTGLALGIACDPVDGDAETDRTVHIKHTNGAEEAVDRGEEGREVVAVKRRKGLDRHHRQKRKRWEKRGREGVCMRW